MKKLIAGLSLFALAFAVMPAGAATISNVADSTARITYRLSTLLNLSNSNSADISNEIVTSANSGNNSISSSDFQSGTGISTGNATSVADILNEANDTSVTTELDTDFGPTGEDLVTNIWDDSDARIRNRQRERQTISNSNTVEVMNAVVTGSDTGSNETTSDEGLQESSITTGEAASATGVTSRFNRVMESISRMIR